jgi:hypothetical protein
MGDPMIAPQTEIAIFAAPAPRTARAYPTPTTKTTPKKTAKIA